MRNLPKEIKLSDHAKQRLEERNTNGIIYNTKNLMRSSVKWYGKDDLIYDCALYRHCCYTTRKSNNVGYITDGNIEILYVKETKLAITILEVKDKFKPILQFIKPEVLEEIEIKKENRKMKKNSIISGVCTDCGKQSDEIMEEGVSKGLCPTCRRRKQNAKARNRVYIPYINLSQEEKLKIDIMQNSHRKQKPVDNKKDESPVLVVSSPKKQDSLIDILRECGCEIPEKNLTDTLNVLMTTDKLKDLITTITENSNQQTMLDLEQALNVVERKLQHDWEYNDFQDADTIKFKNFLKQRRTLKSGIFFWKKLYQTNTLIEMQRAWNAYTQDPNEKILLAGDRINSIMKRFQITTESVSTIFNTRKPFTRVFYAENKEDAHEQFVKWMADRQLHEDPKKTVITELKNEGENPNKYATNN